LPLSIGAPWLPDSPAEASYSFFGLFTPSGTTTAAVFETKKPPLRAAFLDR